MNKEYIMLNKVQKEVITYSTHMESESWFHRSELNGDETWTMEIGEVLNSG